MIVFATDMYVVKTIILDRVLGQKLSPMIAGTIIGDIDFGRKNLRRYHGCIPKSTTVIAGAIKHEY